MILPKTEHAAQEIGTAQEWTVEYRGSADHDVAAATGGDVTAVVSEFLSRKPIAARLLEERCIELNEFFPGTGGRKIDFEDTGIRGNTEGSQARIGRRRITLKPYRHSQILA